MSTVFGMTISSFNWYWHAKYTIGKKKGKKKVWGWPPIINEEKNDGRLRCVNYRCHASPHSIIP
jgi:hypothetical protein